MDRKENIRNAYRLTGSNNFYDGMITCSTVSGKAVCRLVWDMGKEECGEYLNKAFTGVPEDFAGKLLEVPVGTGILTMPLYQTLPRADITCLDYSPDMMGQAREKAERMGLQNVQFRQGDVGALPYEDSSFDIVLSLNGFHAFPDKEAAYRETFRVLKPGGTFCGCFYVSGECRRTDRLIKKVYEPMKFFTPPYETVQSLKVRLEGMYADVQLGNVKSIAWFVCRKASARKRWRKDTMSEKITLSGVPETMLQTVYARAKETKTRGAITDNKAVEIIDRLDYDFSMADKDAAMHSGVIARTIVLDKLVKTYLAGHGGAVVVNIACGLDTRCYRMSDYSHWYNLDLPETIAVREKLLPESRKISQIAMSAMDDWGGEIKGTSTDVLVIIEGLTMYLSESDVKRIFDVIAARFDRATVLVETMNPMVVKRFKEKSIEASKAKFSWGVKNGAALAALLPDFRFVEEHSLCEGMAEFVSIYKLLGKIPAISNISNRIVVLEKK